MEGARRTGKSTVTTEFAKNEYKSFILINFAKKNTAVRRLFDDYMDDLDTFFMYLASAFNTKLYERKSVIILDEVQEFPRARECVKFLVEDGRYDYMETGSLISIRENVKNIIIPSEEIHIKMYPMDFDEFCWALGEEMMLSLIRDHYDNKIALQSDFQKKPCFFLKNTCSSADCLNPSRLS